MVMVPSQYVCGGMGLIYSSKGHLTTSGHIFLLSLLERGAICFQQVEVRCDAEHPTKHRTALQNKELSSLKCQWCQGGKSGVKGSNQVVEHQEDSYRGTELPTQGPQEGSSSWSSMNVRILHKCTCQWKLLPRRDAMNARDKYDSMDLKFKTKITIDLFNAMRNYTF